MWSLLGQVVHVLSFLTNYLPQSCTVTVTVYNVEANIDMFSFFGLRFFEKYFKHCIHQFYN